MANSKRRFSTLHSAGAVGQNELCTERHPVPPGAGLATGARNGLKARGNCRFVRWPFSHWSGAVGSVRDESVSNGKDNAAADSGAGRLLSRQDAARYLGMPDRSFRRHVAPHVVRVPVGNRVYYTREELDAWVERRKVGGLSVEDAMANRCTSGSAMRGGGISSRRASEILLLLREQPGRSTRK